MAFARRCHGVYCALELSLTASNGVFGENRWKKMQILNMTKANNTLFKSDAHTCIRITFTIYIEQQAGYAGAADTNCCWCCRHSSVKTQMEQGAKNALGLAMVEGKQKFSAWLFSKTDARAKIRVYSWNQNVQMTETSLPFCLQGVSAVPERRRSVVRAPWKCNVHTKSAAQAQWKFKVVQALWITGWNSVETR